MTMIMLETWKEVSMATAVIWLSRVDNDDNEDDDNDDADETWKEVSMATAVIWSSRSLKAQDRVAPTP